MRFDHAGIATDDGEGLTRLFCELFDVRVAHEETFGGMDVRFLDFGGSYFEILEPTGEGTIATYLDRNGPGIHHVALAAEDIERALDRARGMDLDLIDDEARPGAWGHEVAFLHPNSTGGVLVEFVQH